MTVACVAAAKEVAVDVGHFAAEPGVISAIGRPEFEYNLDLALEVKAELEKHQLKVRFIGEKGDYAVLHQSLSAPGRTAASADMGAEPPTSGLGVRDAAQCSARKRGGRGITIEAIT